MVVGKSKIWQQLTLKIVAFSQENFCHAAVIFTDHKTVITLEGYLKTLGVKTKRTCPQVELFPLSVISAQPGPLAVCQSTVCTDSFCLGSSCCDSCISLQPLPCHCCLLWQSSLWTSAAWKRLCRQESLVHADTQTFTAPTSHRWPFDTSHTYTFPPLDDQFGNSEARR